jgi:hypothetical protein
LDYPLHQVAPVSLLQKMSSKETKFPLGSKLLRIADPFWNKEAHD